MKTPLSLQRIAIALLLLCFCLKPAKAQEKIVKFAEAAKHRVVGVVPAAITGTDGNQEFFICIRKRLE